MFANVPFLGLGFRRRPRYSFPVREYASVPTDSSSAWQKAQEEGIDLSLLEDSLLKTPEARLRENSRALATALALREAMEEPYGRSRTADSTPA